MEKSKISVKDLNLYYGSNHALKNVNMEIKSNAVTAFIGPSGCGKSTFLKCINRMNDLVENVKIEGTVLLDGEDIYDKRVDTTLLRKKVGMVFQQPNPFPMSIYDNIAYGPRLHGIRNKETLDEIVENALKGAAIYEEVKDRLKKSALGLSGGQQQRVLLARALCATENLLLLDEPVTGLDPVATAQFYQMIQQLNENGVAVIMISHDLRAIDCAGHVLHMNHGGSFWGSREEYKNSRFWNIISVEYEKGGGQSAAC